MTMPLTETVAIDQWTHFRGDTATTVATVKSGGVPAANVVVTFTLVKPNGDMVTCTASTDADGQAFFPYRIGSTDPFGTYRSGAAAVSGGTTVYTSASFTVQYPDAQTQ